MAVNLNREPKEEASQEEEGDKEEKESPFTKENEEVLGPFVFHS